MYRIKCLGLTLLVLLLSACSFESDLVSDATCEEGETRADGAVCRSGFWVGGSDLDAETQDTDNNAFVDAPDFVDADPDACIAESDEDFCARYSKNCGIYEDLDNCGNNRQATCGMCDPGDDCTDNVCECTPETDEIFCMRQNKNCDMFTGDDNCGAERTADCGECRPNETCGEQAPNVCGCPCNIGGECFPEGAVNPADPCEVCDPMESTTAWTLDIGKSCDDGDLCTENDVCGQNGACAGDSKDCSANDGECRVGMCDPSTGNCFGEAQSGTTCADDGLGCTDDLCNMGTCEHTLQAGNCLIDVNGTDTCFSGGTANPDNGCEACTPATSTTDWSADDGGSCSDPYSCTTDTCIGGSCQSTLDTGRCLIANTCYADSDTNPQNSCEVCDSSTDTADWVSSGNCCEIAGTSYPDGTLNPTNSCEECDTNNDTMNWSPVASGPNCCPANSGSWTCNGSGSCMKGNGDLDTCPPP